MKYIITESQYNLIMESEKYINIFQELINKKLDYIRKFCDMSADNSQGDIGWDSCDQIEQVEKVVVTSADWVAVMHSNSPQEHKYMNIKIMIYYSSIKRGEMNANDLIYDLRRILLKSTSMPLILNYESTNINKNFEW